MAFQDIPVEAKVKAVCTIIGGGEKIQPTAKRYGITRPSLYAWVERAQQAIEEALKPYKRGPKFTKPKVDPNVKKIEKLNELLQRHQAQIRELEEIVASREKEEPKPEKCDRCGCQKIYKNGTFKIRPKRFFDLLKLNKEKEVSVQKFICACCGQSLYPKDKGAFFWWANRHRA